MRKTTFLIFFLALLFLPIQMKAQLYQSLSIGGFNADVVAEDTGTALDKTTHGADADTTPNCFKALNWKRTAGSAAQTTGFPNDGIINSMQTAGISFQLQPYNGNNAIRLDNTVTTATATITNTVQTKKLYVLATSGNGATDVSCVVTFQDNTSQTFTLNIKDWYNGTPFAFNGIGRVARNTTSDGENDVNNPRLYQMELIVDAANQSKNIQSIQFTRTSTGAGKIANIFAITAEVNEACPSPETTTFSAITTTGATATWTAPAVIPAQGYQYELRTSGAPGSGTTGFVSGGPVTGLTTPLSGLIQNTIYYFYIKSICSATESSVWRAAGSFTTLCGIAAIPYFEGFETGHTNAATLAACWTQVSITGTQTWTANNTNTDYNRSPRTGGWNAYLRYSNEDWMFTAVQLDAGTQYRLRFYARQDGSTGTNASVKASVGTAATEAGMTITVIPETNIVNGNYQKMEAIFQVPTSGVYHLGINGKINGSPWYISIDDISLIVAPTCYPPDVPTLSNLAANSVTATWTAAVPAPGSGYTWEVRATGNAGDPNPTATGTVAAGVLTDNINELDPNTTYTLYLRSNCSATDVSEWTEGVTFTTLCAPEEAPTAVQSFTDFDSTAPDPACWSEATGAVAANSILSGTTSKWAGGTFANTGSNTAARINLYAVNSGDWLISHPIDLGTTAGVYRIKYDMAVTSYSGTTSQSTLGSHIVRVIISTDGGTTWSDTNIIKTYTGAGSYSNTGQTETINLLNYSGVVKFAFVATTSSYSPDIYFFIDNFVVEPIPACLGTIVTPVTNITKNSATLNWEASDEVSPLGYEYEVRSSGDPGSGAAGLAAGGTVGNVLTENITGLAPSTEYTVYVRTKCSETSFSAWSPGVVFETLCNHPDLVSTTPGSICGVGTVDLEAQYSEGTVQWFATATGGSAVHSGAIFTTPELSTTTSYWVSAGGQTMTGGKSTPGTAGTTPSTYGLIFDVTEAFTLTSVDVFLNSSSAGNLIIRLTNSAGNTLQEVTIAVPAGSSSTPFQYTLPLNFNIPVGTGYRLLAVSGPSMIRDFSEAGYPYNLGTVGSITSGFLTSSTLTTYYYFYNWNIATGCLSPRTEVVATVTAAPELALSSTAPSVICEGTSTEVVTVTSGGSDYTTYTWEPAAGVSGDAATGWTFAPSESTTYKLTASTADGCTEKIDVQVEVNPLPDFTPLEEEYIVCQDTAQELDTHVFLGSEVIVGTATTKSGNFDAETAFMNRWTNTRQQYVYTKDELNALGFTAGTIEGLAFEVASLGSSATNASYTIKMKQVTNNTVTSTTFVNSGFTTVYGPVSKTHTATGWQTITFTTPFVWDGTSNILIELTHKGANSANNAQTYYTETAENTGVAYQGGTADNTTGTLTKKRLNTKFLLGAAPTVVWSPVTDLYTDAAGTQAYSGESLSKVYFKKSSPVSDTAYTVTITGGNGCSTSLETSVTVPFITSPVVESQQFCTAVPTSDIDATTQGGSLKWYPSASSTEEISTITQTGVYYVASEDLGCSSDRVAVLITIAGVSAPSAAPTQHFCGGATVGDLTAQSSSGYPMSWYATESATTALAADTPLVDGTTYYVSEKASNCESPRVAVVADIKPIPEALASNTYSICGFRTFATAEVGALASATVTWYSSATATQPMSSTTQIVNGTYYATQTVGNCESARSAITFTVYQNLPVPTSVAQTFCGSGTVSQLEATGGQEGAEYLWYSSATATTPLSGSTALTNGTYYVSQKAGDCESGRKAVIIRVVNTTPPSVSPYSFCGSATVSDLTLPDLAGVTYNWYISPASTTPLAPNTALTNGTTYFVSKVQLGCESSRVGATVTLLPAPSSPTGPSEQSFVIDIPSDATVSDLIADQEGVVWYITADDAKTGNNPLQDNMPLVSGQTYYGVVIGSNGCPSAPLAVTVTVTLGSPEFDKSMLRYYPNPVNDILTISYSHAIDRVVVYNLIGQRVKEISFGGNEVQVDMSGLSSGTYMVELHLKEQVQFIKILKK